MVNKATEGFKWTSDIAYIVGLLVTDGNLSKDGRHINMRSSDKDLLETFKSCLRLKNKISQSFNNGYAKKPSYRLQFGDVRFYRWLVKVGLSPAKTYTIGEINIPDQFFRDFLRGHLDGDGSIVAYIDEYNVYKGRQYKNQRLLLKFISASENHIRWLYKRINSLQTTKGSLTSTSPKEENKVKMWSIKYAKMESIKLLRWIYYKDNLPKLQRKALSAEKIILNIQNEKRRKYSFIKK